MAGHAAAAAVVGRLVVAFDVVTAFVFFLEFTVVVLVVVLGIVAAVIALDVCTLSQAGGKGGKAARMDLLSGGVPVGGFRTSARSMRG